MNVPHSQIPHPSHRPPKVLLTRTVTARTFGSLGGFMALIFLGSGIYLLQEEFSDPLRAQGVGLIAGAAVIALATVLIYYVFFPSGPRKPARPPAKSCVNPEELIIEVPIKLIEEDDETLVIVQD
jgi:hypothetical protein